MPYFITWIEKNKCRTVSVKNLSETIYLIKKKIYSFNVEYFKYTKT